MHSIQGRLKGHHVVVGSNLTHGLVRIELLVDPAVIDLENEAMHVLDPWGLHDIPKSGSLKEIYVYIC